MSILGQPASSNPEQVSAPSSVLIVDDNASNLLLTRFLLERENFTVDTAGDAEQALEMLKTLRPSIILLDIQLPGMDGLELARLLKKDARVAQIPIVALTAYAMLGDERKALDAGCAGYITKPIDSRTLPATVRQYIVGAAVEPDAPVLAARYPSQELEFAAIRNDFLADSVEQSLLLLGKKLESLGDPETRTVLHKWAGTSGMLGFPTVSNSAREAEALLDSPAPNQRRVRTIIEDIARSLDAPAPVKLNPLPAMVTEGLNGARVASVGFDELQSNRISEALASSDAFYKAIDALDPPAAERIFRPFDLIFYRAAAIQPAEWTALERLSASGKRVVISATRDLMPAIHGGLAGRNLDFVIEPWDIGELLLRGSLLLSRQAPEPVSTATRNPQKTGQPTILVADDDPTITSLLKATLDGYGIDCACAANGQEALALARSNPPDAIVLDVRMPHMDGFEVLSALRQDKRFEKIPVILLTALQQETDLIRGFGLGADDYVVKPFSPMELVARLRRLLRG